MGVLNIQENLRHRRNGESEQTLEQELWVHYRNFVLIVVFWPVPVKIAERNGKILILFSHSIWSIP